MTRRKFVGEGRQAGEQASRQASRDRRASRKKEQLEAK